MSSGTSEIIRMKQGPVRTSLADFTPLPMQTLYSRFIAHGWIKLAFFLVVCLWCQLPYFLLQHYIFFPVTQMPAFALDRMIPFVPLASWPYLSVHPGAACVPLLMVKRRELLQCLLGFSLIALVSNIAFFFYPTAITRPETGDVHFLWAWIRDHVRPLCACPSLHASLVTFFTLWGNRMLRDEGRGRLRVVLWVWMMTVLCSTLLTKQHVLLDLVAGMALACVAYFGLEVVNPLGGREPKDFLKEVAHTDRR
jgi:membrane-associated phospholipid phosphatase